MPAGRPSKLSQVVDAYLANLRSGLPLEAAAARAKVGRSTIFRWLERGRKESKGEFRDFWNKHEEAEGVAEALMVEAIVDAARTDPRYYQWLLEKRFPQRWSSRQQYELSGPDGGPLSISGSVQITLSADGQSFGLGMGRLQPPEAFSRS